MSYSKHFYVDRALESISAEKINSDAEKIFIVFVAYLAKKNDFSIMNSSVKDVLDKVPVRQFAVDFFYNAENLKDVSLKSFEKVSKEDFELYLREKIENDNIAKNYRERISSQPETLNDLCCRFLDIQENDSIIDLGSGISSFLNYVSHNYDCAELVGVEKFEAAYFYGNMLSEITDSKANLIQSDILDYQLEKKYDKVFSFPPISLMADDEKSIEYVSKKLNVKIGKTRTETVFLLRALDLLNKGGKAVVCVPAGFLFSKEFQVVRQYLVQNKLMEAVIELPSGTLYPYTGVMLAVLVLSFGNENIRFINATSIYTKNRRGGSVLYSNDVNTIYNMYFEDSALAKSVSSDIVVANDDCSLSSIVYLHEAKIEIEGFSNYQKLGDLVSEKITRGVQLKAEELDNLETTAPTGLFYLSSKNIQSNRIEKDLLQLTNIDAKYSNLLLRNDDILLVMVLTDSLKVACVEDLSTEKILPASNLYIIRVNKELIEPLFLKMLLETEKANKLFKTFSNGQSSILSIGVDFLNKVQIPVPPKDVQEKLVKKYSSVEQEQKLLESRIQEVSDEKSKIIFSFKEENNGSF